MTSSLSILPIHSGFDFSKFDCGVADLNKYLQQYAYLNSQSGVSKAWVALPSGSVSVLGYYASCAASVASAKSLPKNLAAGLPGYPVSSALIAKLAVDRSMQKNGLGTRLLMHCLDGIKKAAATLGIHLVIVDAMDDSAKAYYQKFGFVPFLDQSLRLAYPVASIP